MKTVDDLYEEIGIPCYYCKHAFTPQCTNCVTDSILWHMCNIADDMILKGEY